MKQFGLLFAVLSLALVTSCSKDEDNTEPVIPMASRELTGEFEVTWDNRGIDTPTGNIMVNSEYIIIDKLPAESILKIIIMEMENGYYFDPEIMTEFADSMGNLLYASSYKYPKADLEIKYQLDSYSNPYYVASILGIKNKWSETSTAINIDYEPPYPGETTVIDPAEPNTISFSVEANGVPYRIDLVNKDHDCIAEYNIDTGLWRFQYWFNTYRIINLQTGHDWNIKIRESFPRRHNKEDTLLLGFYAKKKK